MQSRSLRFIPPILAVALALLLSACGSVKKSTARPSGSRPAKTETRRPPREITIDPSAPKAVQTLLSEANSWLGVPYAWGGNDRNGVDCSGFVSQVFLNACSIRLPRTSANQSEYCRMVDRGNLEPGDLVFFDTTGKREGRVSHVGLYIGNGNMIHASSSKGVIVSSIEGNYFGERLLKGGRIEAFRKLEEAEKTAHEDTPAPPAGKQKSRQERKKNKSNTPSQPVSDPQPVTSAPPQPESAPRPLPTVNPEISPVDARALVLDQLIEEKIDSISNIYAR